MKKSVILTALVAVLTIGGCKYNDADIWKVVNKSDERISALEKWKTIVEGKLGDLQGIITAKDYVTGVNKVNKDGVEGYEFTFLHAEPITLYFNANKEVSGTSENSIGVMQDDNGYYWTMGGEPLMVNNKKVYINNTDKPTLVPNAQNSELFDLTIGGVTITVDPRVVGPHPIKSVVEQDNKIIITLNNNTVKELVKWVDFSTYLLPEYTSETPGAKTHNINLPNGFIMRTIGKVPTDWSIDVTGSGADTKLNVIYPSSGSATVSFLISDGKALSVIKEISFKAAVDPANVWVTVTFDGSSPISIPDGTVSVKVLGTSPSNPQFVNNVCNVLKSNASIKNIDLSAFVHTIAIPANAFFMNGMPSNEDHESNFNNTLETIILPASYNGKIFDRAFKNCTALRTITILSEKDPAVGRDVFTGCTSLEHLYVPAALVDKYKALPNCASIVDKITALPENSGR